MDPLRAQVILHTTDNVAKNYVTNSWCVDPAGATGLSDIDEYAVCFKDFYDDLSGILAPPIAQNGHEIKWYRLETPVPPNYPVKTTLFNLTAAPSATPLPSEVALCLSFQGDRQSGFPQNRRRGRVYIGPCTSPINSVGRPSSGARSQLASAAVTLTANLKACSVPGRLAVWSHVDQFAVVVTDGWIDDVWDTQRRRGLSATSRDVWLAD